MIKPKPKIEKGEALATAHVQLLSIDSSRSVFSDRPMNIVILERLIM
jgi:hypothetical protein